MEIFKTFGLDITLTIAQIVNFLVILFILKKFLYKPLFKILKKREDLVKESVEKAEQSKKALAKAETQEKEIIKKAQTNATEIVKDAKEQGAEIIKKAQEEAKKQAATILKAAESQIEQEKTRAERELNKHVAQLAIELLKKSVGQIFTGKEQDEVVSRAVKELGKKPN